MNWSDIHYMDLDARQVIRDWTIRKHVEHWQVICGQEQVQGFLKNPLQISWETAQPEQNPTKNIDRAANRTLSITRTRI